MENKQGYFQGQYFCCSRDIFPGDMFDILRSRNKAAPIKLDKITKVKFTDVKEVQNNRKRFLYGKIVFKASFEDFDYEVDGFNMVKKHKVNKVSRELPFILELNGNVILFFKREEADKYGRRILSYIAFGKEDCITNLTFDIGEIMKAKKKGLFENVWMNSVSCNGNIKKQKQYGEQIDRDSNFLNDARYKKKGIGVLAKTHINDKPKVSVYETGAISICRCYKDFNDNLKMYFAILKQFLPYSNYSTIISSG